MHIPTPSLQEQEKIAKRLDKIFDVTYKKNNTIQKQLLNLDQLENSTMEKIFSNLNGRVFALGDLVNLINGRDYKKKELLDQGKYKVLRVGNLFTSDKWYFSDLELDKEKYCNKGDLLYAWSASFGPHFWSEDSTIYHYHIWKLQFDENVINKDFLYFWFLYDKEKIKKASGTGTTMMHVSKTNMEKRTLTLPTIKEQKEIVQKLNLFFNISKELRNKYHKKSELNNSLENSLLYKEFSYE